MKRELPRIVKQGKRALAEQSIVDARGRTGGWAPAARDKLDATGNVRPKALAVDAVHHVASGHKGLERDLSRIINFDGREQIFKRHTTGHARGRASLAGHKR